MYVYGSVRVCGTFSTTLFPCRLHYAVQGYHEMIQYIHQMSISRDETLHENSKVMLSNLVYHPEYRDVFVSLLRNYNEVVQVSRTLRNPHCVLHRVH